MSDDVQWTVFGGLPIAEPSEDEINHWRKLHRVIHNLDCQIEDMEKRLTELRELRDSLVHIDDQGPNNGALAKMREAKE